MSTSFEYKKILSKDKAAMIQSIFLTNAKIANLLFLGILIDSK